MKNSRGDVSFKRCPLTHRLISHLLKLTNRYERSSIEPICNAIACSLKVLVGKCWFLLELILYMHRFVNELSRWSVLELAGCVHTLAKMKAYLVHKETNVDTLCANQLLIDAKIAYLVFRTLTLLRTFMGDDIKDFATLKTRNLKCSKYRIQTQQLSLPICFVASALFQRTLVKIGQKRMSFNSSYYYCKGYSSRKIRAIWQWILRISFIQVKDFKSLIKLV